MSDDADGSGHANPPPPAGYPPPGYQAYPPPGYQAPPGYQYGSPPGYQGYPGQGYQGYAPPGYQYRPPPGYQYGPPPGYQGYAGPPPGYAAPPGYPPYPAPALKPGVIPLRPLSLSDIFNGAVSYIRANPKATLGLTTIVVVAAQLLTLILQIGPLAATGELTSTLEADEASTAALVASSVSSVAGAIATGLSGILLSGMLTVVIGRAVFGSGISIGEAWQRLKGRLLALIGLAALEFVGFLALVLLVVVVIIGIGVAANNTAAIIFGLILGLGALVLVAYLYTVLSFAPVGIVLERLGIVAAIKRSFALVRNDFWRVFGIRLLAGLVASLIAGAVAVPFSFGGQLLLETSSAATGVMAGLILIAIGGAIGQIITAPFSAGVVVLLYTDRRIRAEAFDLVLRTGAAAGPSEPADSTDHLWLTR